MSKVKSLHDEEPSETNRYTWPQRRPQRKTKASRPKGKKKGLSKWQKLVVEACQSDDEKRAVASSG